MCWAEELSQRHTLHSRHAQGCPSLRGGCAWDKSGESVYGTIPLAGSL